MKSYLAILGDPAKFNLYTEEFFSILNHDETNSAFHLIGASERDVTRNDYKIMYNEFSKYLSNSKFEPLPEYNKSNNRSYKSRIGLFPSSPAHLIRGPRFILAPYPLNSSRVGLKIKSKLLNFTLRPFLPHTILNLGYLPLGGKAAKRTYASNSLDITEINRIFQKARKNKWFDFYYLEAGSGEKSLDPAHVSEFLIGQIEAMGIELPIDTPEQSLLNSRLLVSQTIYGGGIKTVDQVDALLNPKTHPKVIPHTIVIGNISEENISQTYRLLDRVSELNEISTIPVSRIHQ